MPATASCTAPLRRISRTDVRPGERQIAVEMPIAVSFLGIGYAVMMATPADLEDFAFGFALSERLITSPSEVRDVAIAEESRGLLVNIELVDERHDAVLARVRHRVGESSCGLCGIENLEQALRPLPRLRAHPIPPQPSAIFQALEAMGSHQELNLETRAVHGAALFSVEGDLLAIREDVGRHNAFDKLIGRCLRSGIDMSEGFALLTSRCSYELVEKAALAGIPLLATVSAPTSLAIERAEEAGLTLIALARSDEMLAVSDPLGLFS